MVTDVNPVDDISKWALYLAIPFRLGTEKPKIPEM